MTAITRPIRRLFGRTEPIATAEPVPAPAVPAELPGVAVDIPETDPLFAFLQAAPGPVDLSRLELASPALEALRAAGVALVVPLVTQGELIGTLNLGPRLSEQDYSSDDRRLLETWPPRPRRPSASPSWSASRPREAAARERYRAGAPGRPADPAAVPAARAAATCPSGRSPPTTGLRARWVATSTTSSSCRDGRIGVVVGDVTDKGVPAALVMARTH